MKRLRWLLLLVIILAAAWFALPGIVERRFNHTLHAPPYQAGSQAEALHRKLTVADLHGDSLFWGRNLLRRSSRGHIDLPGSPKATFLSRRLRSSPPRPTT